MASQYELDSQLIEWCRRGQLEVVRELVDMGADVRAKDDYALRWSAEHGHLEVTDYLRSIINKQGEKR